MREHARETGKSYAAARQDFDDEGIDRTLRPSVRTENREYIRFLLRANTQFLRPVSGLGIYDVRFAGDPDNPDTIYLFASSDTPKARIAEIARRAKAAWGKPGRTITLFGDAKSGGWELWSSDLPERLAKIGMDLASYWGVDDQLVADL